MRGKYTHKFIIYNKKRIRNNYDGLVEKLANFDSEAIPRDFLENLMDHSEMFKQKRMEFYRKNPSKMCTIDEILPFEEKTNIETNRVLAFAQKYSEFSKLIVAVDYFDGEEEYIEKFDDSIYFRSPSENVYKKFVLGYFYGLSGNELDIFLKEIDLEELI